MQHSARFEHETWRGLLEEVSPNDEMPQITCSDRDEGAVAATRANAERAGLGSYLNVDGHALAAQPWLQPDGARARRRGHQPALRHARQGRSPLLPLYQTLGHRVGKLGPGWRAAVLAHDVRLARRTGLDLEPAFTTKHGGLSVTAMTSSTNIDARADGA